MGKGFAKPWNVAVVLLGLGVSFYVTEAVALVPGDSCTAGAVPGTIAVVGGQIFDELDPATYSCTAVSSPNTGMSCGGGAYYNADALQCVTDGDVCGALDASSAYSNGVCVAPAPTPSTPIVGGDLGGAAAGLQTGATPGGTQQPMCVNASPFIGYGLGITAGTVLCYTGAGKNSNMFAYEDAGGGWNGLNLQNMYARGDITALDTLSVYGGSQLYSADGRTGVVIVNERALIASSDAEGRSSAIDVTPGGIVSSSSFGGNSSSVAITPTSVTTASTDGISISSITVDPDSIVSATQSGANGASVAISTAGVTTVSTNGTATATQSVSATQVVSMSSAGTDVASVNVESTGVITRATDGAMTSGMTVTANQAGLQTHKSATEQASITANAESGAQMLASVASGTGAAVTIAGSTSGTNTSKTGVLITGDGNGAGTGTVSAGVANWSDVRLQSKNYGAVGSGLGSAVVVNDYGVQIISPELLSGGESTNTLGSGANNQVNSTVNNRIGEGGAGTVNNYIGGGGGSTNNYIGNTSIASTVNMNAGSSSFNMSDGVVNMSGGAPLATNGSTGTTSAIGSGGMAMYSSARQISVTDPGENTINNALYGKSYQNKINGNLYVDGNVYINGTLDYVASDSANTTVTSLGSGASILAGATQGTSGGTAIVMKGTSTTHTVVDVNGRISNVNGEAAQSSAAMTLTNGYGNTHGIVVNETQTTISGGINSSSMTLSDNGARFSNSSNGKPITVTGVADGKSDYDAVNFRQLRSVAASSAAMSNIPQLQHDKVFSLGMGVGYYEGRTALALGANWRGGQSSVMRATLASGTSSGDKITVGLGAAFGW